jgi:cyclopropane-fatty-acyl-phospholipid synthase
VKAVSLASDRHLVGTPKPRALDRLAQRLVRRQLERLEIGRLTVIDQSEEGGETRTYGEGDWPAATITVHEPAFFADIAFGGSIGAGEAYMAGAWSCDDLVALVRLLLRNRHVLEGMEGGAARVTRPLQKLFQKVNRNTREGARRNISAHYDLGNEFFALWLDETMMYSSAIFERDDMSLYEAQIARLDSICRKLELGPEDHLVEIGTGWGGLALHAVQNYGCRVTTTTISRQQYDKAVERVAAAGLEDRITVLLDDYRDLQGRFDKLVSIEMIEAIGWRQFDTYFEKCGQLLKPGGKLLIQAITIAEQRYEEAKRSVDFIQRYIFPGSNLPSVKAMAQSIAARTDLMITGLEDIGLHYATTLNRWRRNFFERIDEVRALGYPEEFIRMWEYYLCYCEGGFLDRSISDVHLLAEKPLVRV